MDRARVVEEVVEILANKLHQLPPPANKRSEAEEFDYESQSFAELTANPLDVAEVMMDLEDAFGITFEDTVLGGKGTETVGQAIDLIHTKVNRQRK